MKKKLFKGLIIVLGIAFLVLPFTKGRADSGFDASYSGSSGYSGGYSSSSSYSSGYDFDYGSSGGNASPFTTILLVGSIAFIGAAVLIFTVARNLSGIPMDKSYDVGTITQEEIDQKDPSINAEELTKYTYDLFVKVHNAYSNFNYEELKYNTSSELYTKQLVELEAMEKANEKNIHENVEFIEGGVVIIHKLELVEEVQVKLRVMITDYTVNNMTGRVVQGNKKKVEDITYIITLERSSGKIFDKCPECGIDIVDKSSQRCHHCGTILIKGSDRFVMSKETIAIKR